MSFRSFLLFLILAGCATQAPQQTSPPRSGAELARNERFVVVRVEEGEDLADLALRYYGDAGKAWQIAEFNQQARVRPGEVVPVPLKPVNPTGVQASGFQTVAILCYHRFGTGRSKLVVSSAAFEAQMNYLARNGYHVIRLSQLTGFLQGNEALPRKSVVLTIDDGYRSTYQQAYPILRKYGFPATVFLYTDFVGAGDALTWAQMQEMAGSGLVTIQPHSKTHGHLVPRTAQESEAQYRARLRLELDAPVAAIRAHLSQPITSYAFPYGETDETVSAMLAVRELPLGLTVTPGGNAFFAHRYMLRRTMIFGDDELSDFISKLNTFSTVESR